MTPSARYSAAIEILDLIEQGNAAAKSLLNWGRRNRYAGSKDRAAIRDIVFDCLRQKRSLAHFAGFTGSRGLVLSQIVQTGAKPEEFFGVGKYAPAALTDDERAAYSSPKDEPSGAVSADIPDFIADDIGLDILEQFQLQKHRAPLDLRVNLSRGDLEQAQKLLSQDAITTDRIPAVRTGLRVTQNERKLNNSEAFQNGFVEIQDAGAQKLIDALTDLKFETVLDYCAGGGGKSLAIADQFACKPLAYDLSQSRMHDISARAQRAKVEIEICKKDPAEGEAKFDLLILDVPCSGSGAWRRNPDAKWKLSPEQFEAYQIKQAEILNKTQHLVGPEGYLAYMTCSILAPENEEQISKFLENSSDFEEVSNHSLSLTKGTDGFFLSILKRK